MPSNVTVIAPTASLMVNQFDDIFKKIKVCSYARVSTKDEEQLTSYESQKEYYTQYIKSNPTQSTTEMDTVYNQQNGPYIQTFIFENTNLIRFV